MNRNLFVVFFSILFAFSSAQADVLVEGEVDVRFKVLNLADFPDYSFYIEYQGYYYEEGWQTGDIVQVPVKEGDEVEAGERGSTSKLYAMNKEGEIFQTSDELGGNKNIDDYNASYILQEIEIEKISGNMITYRVVDQYKVYPDGKTKRLHKGMVLTGVYLFGFDIGLVLLPIVCLGGLIFFFWMRRNPVREQAA